MKKILLLTALALAPVSGFAEDINGVPMNAVIDFDADGDGVVDKIGVLKDGCDKNECPVELFTNKGRIVLGYGENVETGYVSPKELGLNDVTGYPENVPVIQIDGVIMAFNGEVAYPVADLISKDALKTAAVTADDLKWIKARLNADIQADSVFKAVGDLSPEGGDVVYSVYTGSMGNTSAWFIKEANGAEAARGFSMDYPRIYPNGNNLRIVSVSQSGLGIMDIKFPETETSNGH